MLINRAVRLGAIPQTTKRPEYGSEEKYFDEVTAEKQWPRWIDVLSLRLTLHVSGSAGPAIHFFH